MARRADGAMPLAEHLRELRSRIIKSLIAIAVGMTIAWIWYARLFAILRKPFDTVMGDTATLALTGVADPFTLQIQVSAVGGVVLASPVWLYQLWRFITPGLLRNERRWTAIFIVIAVPLMGLGVWLAYTVMPIGLQVLFGFTPEGVQNIVGVDRYLGFFFRMLLVFGVGFLTPFILVLLNFADLVRGRTLIKSWRGIVMGTMVFGAVATPTGDPVNLLLLSGPILVLMFGAIGIALLNDRRRRRKGLLLDFDQWDDNEQSPIA